jgi:hypothetical protein
MGVWARARRVVAFDQDLPVKEQFCSKFAVVIQVGLITSVLPADQLLQRYVVVDELLQLLV